MDGSGDLQRSEDRRRAMIVEVGCEVCDWRSRTEMEVCGLTEKIQRQLARRSFLTGGVPDLSLDDFGIDVQAVSSELDTNGVLRLKVELVLGETLEVGLFGARVVDEDHLDEVNSEIWVGVINGLELGWCQLRVRIEIGRMIRDLLILTTRSHNRTLTSSSSSFVSLKKRAMKRIGIISHISSMTADWGNELLLSLVPCTTNAALARTTHAASTLVTRRSTHLLALP
ncbi:hypothetical protein PIB30_026461 [Stylosanthes scabra]|uniref:Uncharacterized protein n=1 Tax=Stylosanthes scabra TaxID=79078 RepID=A0ABU6VBB4_9FABA|nr:hypothetical protein [Stylosanthes scabra]